MSDSSMKHGATLCLALAMGPGSTLVDDFLGHRDNISTGLNQRQKAEMKVPPGFVEGSTLNGFLRNYYLAHDSHDTSSRRDQREWAQGLMLSSRSGHADTPIGIDLDAHAFYGLRLGGGGGSGGVGALPLDSAGHPVDSFPAAGVALKLCGLDSLLKIGDQLLENPVIASGVSRVVPQSYRGVTLKNYHFRVLEPDAGFVEATRLRNQSGHSHLTSGCSSGTKGGIAADHESPHIAWLGISYSAPGGSQVTLYSGRPEDIWNQYYLGLSQSWRFSNQLTLTPWLYYYKTRGQGRNQPGRIGNDPYNAGLTLAGDGQSLSLSLQKVDGDTPFDFITQDDRTFLYESSAMQYADFNDSGERLWKIQYQASLAFLVVPDWQFGAVYGRSQADLTWIDPDNVGYGYLYNPNGRNAQYWERDLLLCHVFPVDPAKGLSVTLRWATHRPGEGYTALGNTRGSSSSGEYWVVVDYPIRLL